MSDISPERARADLRLAWIIVGASALLTLSLLATGAWLLVGRVEGWASERGRALRSGLDAGQQAQEARRRAVAEAAEPSDASDAPLPVSLGPAPPDTAQPIGTPATWIRTEDYPPTALRKGYEGRVRVTVAVDRAGSPTGCAVRLSSGHWSLDNATCAAMLNNGRFAPSLGLPRVRSWTSPVVRWAIPAMSDVAKKAG